MSVEMPIPKLMHFIWINRRNFGEGEYVSVMSAILNTSYKVVLHTDIKPNQIKGKYDPYKIEQKHDKFRIEHQTFPEDSTIQGVLLPVALISDVYRINILQKWGGMYSDLDILWLEDLPVDLSKIDLIGTYDLESYRHLTNSFMGCAKGYKPFKELNTLTMDLLKHEYERGNRDMREGKTNYFRIYKLQCGFIKERADFILPQRIINKNTHARIGRVIKGEDKLRLTDIYAFNWYNSMYKFEDVKKMPGFKEFLVNILPAK
jgi:hypothetical protein